MKENKNLSIELEKNGYSLCNLNIHNKEFLDKKGYGIIQNYWYENELLHVLVRTGLKKDVLVSTKNNKNNKRLLVDAIKNKRIPFYVNKSAIEDNYYNSGVYGLIYLLRNKELLKIGREGSSFGLWNGNGKEVNLEKKFIIECKFLYSEKKGFFFSGINNQEFYLPKGEHLVYFSRQVDYKVYYKLVKSLKILLNLVLQVLKGVSLISIIQLSKDDKIKLLKRIMILDWLVVTYISKVLYLLDNDSWKWRYNFYYLLKYINELSLNLNRVKKILKVLLQLDLTKNQVNFIELEYYKNNLILLKTNKYLEYLKGIKDYIELHKEKSMDVNFKYVNFKYVVYILNLILKSELENELLEIKDKIDINPEKNTINLVLIQTIDDVFKKSVVSLRQLKKTHSKIKSITKVDNIKGLVFNKK